MPNDPKAAIWCTAIAVAVYLGGLVYAHEWIPKYWSSIKGVSYMAGIAAIFGYWQQSVAAGVFMLALLLFIEKLVRWLAVSLSGR